MDRHTPPATPQPIGNHSYFDTVAVWFQQPLDDRTWSRLSRCCGDLVRDPRPMPARFDRRYKQRLELKQPSIFALRMLADRSEELLINRVDIALDSAYSSAGERDRGYDYLDAHVIRPWHNGADEVHVVADERHTRYDIPGNWVRPNGLAVYPEEYGRITGEVDITHVEWRSFGVRPVRSMGVRSAADLVGFDFRAFWRRRLVLVDVSEERLGRYIRNRRERGKSRQPKLAQWAGREVNLDKKEGGVFLRSLLSWDTYTSTLKTRMQDLIDEYGRGLRLQRGRPLVNLPNEAWLPARSPT